MSETSADEDKGRGKLEGAVEALIQQEIGRFFQFMLRARLALIPVMMLCFFLLLWLEPVPWKLWGMGGTFVLVTALLLYDLRWAKNRRFASWYVLYGLALALFFHTALILVSGGMESPFLVLYILMAVIPAITTGRLSLFLLWALLPLSLLWGLTIGGVTGLLPRLMPSLWEEGIGFYRNATYGYTQATVFTLSIILGGLVVHFLRAAFDRMVRTAIAARYELAETMKAQNKELWSLSGSLAHELKNPLASIQGLTGLLARKLPEGSKEAEQMEVLRGESRRMGAIIEEFLGFSRPLTELTVREVKPAQLLHEVEQLHEALAQKEEIILRVHAEEGGAFSCDPRKVKQILANLLQNALDATPAGGTVTLYSRGGAGEILFCVEDTGPGIAEEMRGRLFTPGHTTKAAGSGLGLTIARVLAEQHGGSLVLKERLAGGCRALLTLPLQATGEEQQG